jgi:ATP-dependent Clp protease ATP-binding subunit ClpA
MSSAQDPRREIVQTIHRSAEIAHDYGHEYVTLEHLLSALLEDETVEKSLLGIKADVEAVREGIQAFLDGNFISQVPDAIPTPTNSFDDVVKITFGKAYFSQSRTVKPIDLLINMLEYPSEDSFALTLLLKHGASKLALKRFLAHGNASPAPDGPVGMGVGGGGMSEQAAPITTREEAEKYLAKFCTNLNVTAKDKKIDPLIGRADEVARIIQISARRSKNNTVLVGEPGVGKTAIAEGLALKIVRKEVPAAIQDSVVYALDIGSLVAGTKYRGEFEERMKQVLVALSFIPNVILFIDEIHMIMGAGGSSGSPDAANLLKPALARGHLRCIGATTQEEYRKYFEKDRALLRRFKKVTVDEPSVADAKAILAGLAPSYAEFHGVTYTAEAIEAAVDLTHRYVSNAQLPDKAIDIIDAAGARQRVAPEGEKKLVIDLAEIEFEVSSVAKIPATTVAEDEGAKYGRLEDDLRAKVFDQEDAITSLTDAVLIARAGLREPNKPQGSYLFTGPTGVGKTEVAKQLAATLGIPLLRYDMSEYMEKHAVARLIGAPPGYVGYGEGGAGNGKLTNDVDASPYCVLLLDEVEKAHPDVFNILLQVMDDGRLTNSAGKTVDFRNVILIMTSNAGAREAAKNKIGFGSMENKDGDVAKINDLFSPEFRNRLDAIVRFKRLTKAGIDRVVVKFLDALRAQVSERGVSIEITEEAQAWLAEKGYDPAMGARPLARVINDNIKKPLARAMLFGGLKDGGRAVVSRKDDGLEVLAA